MGEELELPLFPLTLLPLPGELVPLHIFEPRYRALLEDMERSDIRFGIFCNHEVNHERIGSVMKLESVIKRYKGGESDIVVRCVDVFSLEKMFRTFKDRPYPGGNVSIWHIDTQRPATQDVYDLFVIFQKSRRIAQNVSIYTLHQIACELNLDLYDRYKLLTLDEGRASLFVINQIRFQLHLIDHENKSRDLFHLN